MILESVDHSFHVFDTHSHGCGDSIGPVFVFLSMNVDAHETQAGLDVSHQDDRCVAGDESDLFVRVFVFDNWLLVFEKVWVGAFFFAFVSEPSF